MKIPSPEELHHKLPLSPKAKEFLFRSRERAKAILQGKDPRRVIIMGPCSIHEREAAIEYAMRLNKLSLELQESFFLIMRFFIEKPRTKTGWKGILYDPHLDGSNDLASGLRQSRELLLTMAEMGVPCAAELLEPLAIPYLEDLLTWGLIGARTSASQPHRQMASGLSFPIGFKNSFDGEIETALWSILSSKAPHAHLGIDMQGKITAIQTNGNPFTHLVLRGSEKKANYDPASVAYALHQLRMQGLEPRLLIDCSHGNSGKEAEKQKIAFHSVMDQIHAGRNEIAGLMLESHIHPGKQLLKEDPSSLRYGVSITDDCLCWEETESLLRSITTIGR